MTDQPKTKKLINDPDDVIAELVEGMAGAHPDLLRIEGEARRALVAQDGPRDGKVAVVIGGGSGHEPLFSGYVGRGLADAAAIGNVFASPSPGQIAEAARAAEGGAGVLFLYGNYTGDVMNFDMAAEMLAAEGIEARSLQVRDDVASAPKDRRAERRGIAGDIFVFKVAGASADLGHPLDEVERLAARADAATASMGVALGPCSLPQTLTPNFEIGASEMEIGMGIHGEQGVERLPVESADRVAERLTDAILADLELPEGAEVAVMVNGLGSTSMMELYILHRRVAALLGARGIGIHRSWVGNYATSLEMAGASVTLLRLDEELKSLLDHPCHTLGLQIGQPATATSGPRRRGTGRGPGRSAVAQDREALATEGDITPARFREMMTAVAEQIGQEKAELSRLDGAIGDGDHGVTMDLGWRATRGRLEGMDGDATITEICRAMSEAFLDAVGASAGPLYATGFLRAGAAVEDRLVLDPAATARWIAAMAEGIRERGGAAPGDKTMVDAWDPAGEAALRAAPAAAQSHDCLVAAAEAAEAGAEATRDLVARYGRAAKLGERTLGHADPGAVSAALILRAMADATGPSGGEG